MSDGNTATLADTTTPRLAWEGLLIPYDRPSVDGRVIRRPPGGARVRDLPLELKYQQAAQAEHDGAIIGLASITRVWEDDTGLWGSGEFDASDPAAVELARKIREGFVGHVSVDLGDVTTRQMQSGGHPVLAVTDWKLISTTVVADAAMDGARIYVVDDTDKVASTADVLATRKRADGVFRAADTDETVTAVTLTFATKPATAPALTLAVTAATNLPWAPRNTTWDQAGARRRMAERCGGVGSINPNCYQRGFIYRDNDADPALVGSYSFPFADVIDGELRAVLRGVQAAAQRVDSAGITSADKTAVRDRIRALYRSAARAFDDDTIGANFSADTTTVTMGADVTADPTTIDDDGPDDATMDTVETLAADDTGDPTAADPVTEAINRAVAGMRDELSDIVREALRDVLDVLDDTTTPDDTSPDMPDDTGDDIDEPAGLAGMSAETRLRVAVAERRAARRRAAAAR